jgi:hypothetical protein
MEWLEEVIWLAQERVSQSEKRNKKKVESN